MSIPERISNFASDVRNTISTGVTNAASNVTNFAEGSRSAQNQEGRMKLFPPPPFSREGYELSSNKKILNGVFGATAGVVLAIAYAPVAAYKNILLNKQEKLLDHLKSGPKQITDYKSERARNDQEIQNIEKGLKSDDKEIDRNALKQMLMEAKGQKKLLNRLDSTGHKIDSINKKLAKVDTVLGNMDVSKLAVNHNLKNELKGLKEDLEKNVESLKKEIVLLNDVNKEMDLDPQIMEPALKQNNREITKLEIQIRKIDNKLEGRPDSSAYEMRKARMSELKEDVADLKKNLPKATNNEERESIYANIKELNAEYTKLSSPDWLKHL